VSRDGKKTGSVYGGAPPYAKKRATSRAAAGSISSGVDTLRSSVFSYIDNRGRKGATDQEVCFALSLSGSTVRPRRRELEILEHVFDSGFRRETIAGRTAIVWVSVNHLRKGVKPSARKRSLKEQLEEKEEEVERLLKLARSYRAVIERLKNEKNRIE